MRKALTLPEASIRDKKGSAFFLCDRIFLTIITPLRKQGFGKIEKSLSVAVVEQRRFVEGFLFISRKDTHSCHG